MTYKWFIDSTPVEIVLIIVLAFLYTFFLYGSGPFLFYKIRKNPISKRKLIAFSVLYTCSAWFASNLADALLFNGEVSNGGAALLWGTVFYHWLKNRLLSSGKLITAYYTPHPSEEGPARPPSPDCDAQTFAQQERQVEEKRVYGPLDSPEKPPKRYAPPWITVILALLCIGLSGGCIYLSSSSSAAQVEIDALQTDIESLTDKLNQTELQYETMQAKQTELKEKNDDLSGKLDFYSSNYWELLADSNFLHWNIGFIVDGSNKYHCYDCPIFQGAEDFWAHNIEYCSYLGYSKCPLCW